MGQGPPQPRPRTPRANGEGSQARAGATGGSAMIQTQAQQDLIENHGMGSNGGSLIGSTDSWTDMLQKKIWDAKINATIKELKPKFTPEKSIMRFKVIAQYPDYLLARQLLEQMDYFYDTENAEWQMKGVR
jgi:hypothetical protein